MLEADIGKTATIRLTFTVVFAIVITSLAAADAQARPAPPGVPSVLCKKHQASQGEGKTTIPGVYSYRPHNCLFHKYQLSRSAFQLYARIKWRYWNPEEAFGRGGIPGIEIDFRTRERGVFYSPATIKLQHPLFVCGHVIFTEAVVDFLEEGPESVYHEFLDRLPVPGSSC